MSLFIQRRKSVWSSRFFCISHDRVWSSDSDWCSGFIFVCVCVNEWWINDRSRSVKQPLGRMTDAFSSSHTALQWLKPCWTEMMNSFSFSSNICLHDNGEFQRTVVWPRSVSLQRGRREVTICAFVFTQGNIHSGRKSLFLSPSSKKQLFSLHQLCLLYYSFASSVQNQMSHNRRIQ